MMIDPLFSTTIAGFLALLFLLTGIHKLSDTVRFKASILAYHLVPEGLITIIAPILIVSELSIGIMLLIALTKPWASVSALLILGLYLSVMVINLHRGRTNIQCGCSVLSQEALLSYWHLLRNTLLMGLTVLLLIPETGRTLKWLDMTQVISGVISLSVLYFSIETLVSNRRYLMQKEVE